MKTFVIYVKSKNGGINVYKQDEKTGLGSRGEGRKGGGRRRVGGGDREMFATYAREERARESARARVSESDVFNICGCT